ncbi:MULTISPECIES: GntR family transcriptional regulator [unclassified Cryobacterium]|uniref:GntR family transcriptional regulator n=1 Tax=unclassified Cryobacterium TaxID=2649013 RepID=UPI002AB3EB6B|nr:MULTISPECIES: GntR family transcriptional regulator [unclassified Cryobacterium]MDY7541693.1 GntR family transcriptional regulator [Cryobacterium sp. 5B3]MEA9999638.1 GntR family transcriptional regulator [Cryobacterium sp. RTS3]MEB0266458.1 GntR family transcriptional regulator [Cryobacterium sp. 10I5]MEB0275453.1 GntR family transcriptional regulator [Cryobacterium sp. 5B3]
MSVTGGQAAFAYLRGRILSGEIPGNATLREQALAEELGVSRTPIREALRRLDETGLVEFVPNKGATVIAWTTEQMRETYYLRAMLESRAAGLAAVRISDGDLDRLAELIALMDDVVLAKDDAGISRLGELNAEFHRIIVTAAANAQLTRLTVSVGRVPLMAKAFRRDSGSFRAVSNHHHRDILAALRSHDALWASTSMRSHILAARNSVQSWDQGDESVVRPGADQPADANPLDAEAIDAADLADLADFTP